MIKSLVSVLFLLLGSICHASTKCDLRVVDVMTQYSPHTYKVVSDFWVGSVRMRAADQFKRGDHSIVFMRADDVVSTKNGPFFIWTECE